MKIKSLIKQLGEGEGFKNRNETSPYTNKDDDLDVVLWKSFSDNCPGKLIGFGQCKTGTYWKSQLKILQPFSFCSKWFSDMPPVLPIRLFFISESILRNRWYENVAEGGVLFDRCRIMDYLPVKEIEEAPLFLSKIKTWNKMVVEKRL
ncbi:MAG TPA: hypothetical protein VK469_01940 [Candidatus Kapabacteria bacterium]|nr:hypothetical protein [Candidatus Kapabacteria bacterium]